MSDIEWQGYQLSPQQEALYQQESISPVQCFVAIEGDLDRYRLYQALHTCVARNEILRTSFRSSPLLDGPLQVIEQSAFVLRWCIIDASSQHDTEQEQLIASLVSQQATLLCSLETPSLLSVLLIVNAEKRHLLILSASPLCADSWTLQSLAKELLEGPSTIVDVEQEETLPLQYADFAGWQLDLLTVPESHQGKVFWLKQVSAPLPEYKLPFQLDAGRTTDRRKVTRRVLALKNDVAHILEIARSYDVSEEAFLFSCWIILLWRLSGEETIVTKWISDGRNIDDLQQVLGPIARHLPLQWRLESQATFAQTVKHVHKLLTEAQEWEIYYDPRYKHTEASQGSGKVYYPFLFAYTRWSLPKTASFSTTLFRLHPCIEPCDLFLFCQMADDKLLGDISYPPALFEGATIERIALNFETLLRSALQNPEAPIACLDILSQVDRALLQSINQERQERLEQRYIHQRFEEHAQRYPQRIAVICGREQITYAELNTRANLLAHLLSSKGVRPEVLVGLFLEKSIDLIVGILAVLKAGGAYVPLDPALPKRRLAYLLDDLCMPIILTHQGMDDELPDYAGSLVVLDKNADSGVNAHVINPNLEISGAHLAYLMYTSGSTGIPKAVMLTHASLLNYVSALEQTLQWDELQEQERAGLQCAHVSSINADLGNTSIFLALATGGCLHLITSEVATDSLLFAQYITEHAIDLLKISPSHLNALLSGSDKQSLLPRKYLFIGGEVFSWTLFDRLMESGGSCQIFNHYGPTEATIGTAIFPVHPPLLARHQSASVPIGYPIQHSQLAILDQELQLVPIGVTGELYIGGICLARGYFNAAVQTAERFIPHPFVPGERLYRTGDLARYLPDGTIEFLKRGDRQVKIRGFRVEVAEIEIVLQHHPAVYAAVVTAVGDPSYGSKLVAYVMIRSGFQLSVNELQPYFAEHLPEYMRPSMIMFVDRLPLTPNGKLDYQALPAPVENVISERPFIAPRTPYEEMIAGIMAQLLGVERISIDAHFFECGGHSLLAMQLIARLRQEFQFDFPIRLLFDYPTAETLSLAIVHYEIEHIDPEEAQTLLQEIKDHS